MLEINRLMAKILIVDDDTTFCIMLRKWLEKRGFEVDAAFSYKEAVKQLDKAGFDLVLTDLRLPDKDGIDSGDQGKNAENAGASDDRVCRYTDRGHGD